MAQQISPFLEGKFGWNYGENLWNTGADENFLKFSFLFDGNVESVVSSLPAVVNGQAYFLTTDNRFYFGVGNTWYSSPCPKYFIFKIRSTGEFRQFDGTDIVEIDNPSQIGGKIEAIQTTIDSLGTAAFVDVDSLATQDELDVASAQANAYTDVLREDVLTTLVYDAGVEVISNNQLVKDGEIFWRVAPSTPLPYTTTGTGMPEGGAFVPVGDAVLRGDLASTDAGKGAGLVSFESGAKVEALSSSSDPESGAALVGWLRTPLTQSIKSVAQALSAQPVSIWEYADAITVKPDPDDWSTWDWQPAIVAALGASKDVVIPFRSGSLSYKSSPFSVTRGNARLTLQPGVNLSFINTLPASGALTMAGDFSELHGGTILTNDSTTRAIRTTGFRVLLNSPQVSGVSSDALFVDGLETICILGKYRGGSRSAIYVNKPDLYLLNTYAEQSMDGIRSDGVGSITAHHVHSFGNTRHGFYLSGASFSQLTGCYADTNGANGYEIRDTTSGLTMIDCWGFKSSNAAAGSNDFFFFNTRGVSLIGCRSSGVSAFSKNASFRATGSSQVSYVACKADIEPEFSSDASNQCKGCFGTLQKYNRPEGVGQSGPYSIAAAATTSFSVDIPMDGNIISPGLMAFEVSLVYRNSTGGTNALVEKVSVLVGRGGAARSVSRIFPTTGNLNLGLPVLTEKQLGVWTLTFDITNIAAYNIQVAGYAQYICSTRGFG